MKENFQVIELMAATLRDLWAASEPDGRSPMMPFWRGLVRKIAPMAVRDGMAQAMPLVCQHCAKNCANADDFPYVGGGWHEGRGLAGDPFRVYCKAEAIRQAIETEK